MILYHTSHLLQCHILMGYVLQKIESPKFCLPFRDIHVEGHGYNPTIMITKDIYNILLQLSVLTSGGHDSRTSCDFLYAAVPE